MQYRPLGNTGLQISEIGLGCEGFSENDCAMTRTLFDTAESLGINYFDLYASDPAVRSAVGKALKGRREKFYIQSHICSVWTDGQYKRTRKLDEVKVGFEEMLRLLDTEYIDVGMIHYCDSLNDWEEVQLGTLVDNPDTDGDGVDDGTEVRIGTDPLRAETTFTSTASTNRIQDGLASVDITV